MTKSDPLVRDGGIVDPGAQERTGRPIVGWAVVGALFATLTLYIFIDYAFSGHFLKSVDKGKDQVPTLMEICIRGTEVFFVVGFVIFVYKVIYKPLRRDRHLGLDALLFVAFWGIMWQDPLYAYSQVSYSYHPAFVNISSWGGSIPGYLMPNADGIPYPIFAIIFAYPVTWLGMAMFGAWLMRKAKERWPSIGKAGLIGICFAAMVFVDIPAELIMVRFGFYTFPGAIEGWTIFFGHYYQFPLYEALTFPIPLTLFAALYYFRNDKGETLVERGLDRVKVHGWRRTGIRFLALLGVANVIWLLGYNIPSIIINLHQSNWPKDFETSYLNPGLCGPGTEYACPGPEIPINRPNSIHIDPDGNAVMPGN